MTPTPLPPSHTREQARAFDRRAAEEFGIPGLLLMENAGRGAAELLTRLNPDRQPTTILCGPGNNGGDGFVVARHLDGRGWPVVAWFFGDPAALPADAAVNYHIARKAGLIAPPGELPRGWVVDALFGTGLSRPLADPFTELVARMNASGNPVLALDIPSGLDCDTGEPLGIAVRATHTATFAALKRGFLNPASRTWTGEVHVIDLGTPRALAVEAPD